MNSWTTTLQTKQSFKQSPRTKLKVEWKNIFTINILTTFTRWPMLSFKLVVAILHRVSSNNLLTKINPSMFYSLIFLFSLSHSSHSRFCSQLRRFMATGLFEAAMPWVHRIVCQSSDGAKRGGKLSSLCRLLVFTQLRDCSISKSISGQWVLKLAVSGA